MRFAICMAALAALVCQSGMAAAGKLPAREGTCTWTKITKVGQRLTDGENGPMVPGSGSWVQFANGGSQVSYEEIPAVNKSRKGDPVLVCLISLPQDCPPGDDRGKVYTTTNMRTVESWTLPDAEHHCGGA